ncbi:hypothetical protein ACFVVA_40160 [Kitasatospora sp. NPDC058048]|uniref:hypothetical protein n=1 Tax=Kitasatospora sp. NPDC058048 TaxID=3346313 RepID=UPI0036DA7DCE
MSTRTRSRRTYGREPLQLSKLNPADVDMLPGVQISIVCRECYSWHRLVGTTDLRVVQHGRGDGERCPGGNRQIKADLTPERWMARRRRQQQDALRAETRRPTTVHIARPRPAAPAPTAAERTQQWSKVDKAVEAADVQRAEPLEGARGPIVPLTLPAGARPITQKPTADEVLAASPLRRHRGSVAEPETLLA